MAEEVWLEKLILVTVVVELYEDGDEWKCTIHFFLVAKAKQWTFFSILSKKGT